MTQLASAAVLAACTKSSGPSGSGPAAPAAPVAKVTFEPADGATDVNPLAPVSLSVANGHIDQVALSNPNGKQVTGQLSADKSGFKVTEPLGYGVTYSWSGTAIGTDGKPVPITGKFSVVNPAKTLGANINIGDGQEVGIAAPLMLQFMGPVENKAGVEKALSMVTNPPTEGSWAWLPPSDKGSRAHWRPKEYWQPGTTVQFTAKLYGQDLGGGAFGDQDISSNFTIGRSQIVKGVASSHRVQVYRDGALLFDFPCSYGEGDVDRNVTRSGIHVVTEKYQDFYMSNPAAGYSNVHERWAVRISDNGEFIHANPESAAAQGNSNVTNGCINLSTEDAATYFPTAMYGDPVEVSGTRLQLSAVDGDIYDWSIDYETWKSMSALGGEPPVASGAPVASPTALAPAPR
ncbi:L,D-transpeptidase [Nocardia stercoris]|uniref:L,D-transpeptidase n=1 Tax=Nocardia stercoris TaxID=2483361 RepID=A0A3M2KZY1_9NOCA|nr:Ig-like domain-containing protein [Nocardia stercoris]RMI31029.1 L,D-transpeptidase [Nocardia stercoris]